MIQLRKTNDTTAACITESLCENSYYISAGVRPNTWETLNFMIWSAQNRTFEPRFCEIYRNTNPTVLQQRWQHHASGILLWGKKEDVRENIWVQNLPEENMLQSPWALGLGRWVVLFNRTMTRETPSILKEECGGETQSKSRLWSNLASVEWPTRYISHAVPI